MILITGGLGYIGPQLVNQLKQDQEFRDHKIVILDSLRGRFDYFGNPNKSHRVFRKIEEEFPSTELVVGDIRHDTEQVHRFVEKADYIFHLAAVTGADYSNDHQRLYWETIFDGSMNIFQAAKETDLKGLINISSCNIYGRSPEKNLTEESEKDPINTYAKAKSSAEDIISERAASEDVPVASLRLATNFGAQKPSFGGTRYNLVINKFVKQALENKPLTPYGNGENWRPFIHVCDSARMIKEVAKEDFQSGARFNAGFNDMNFQIKEIAERVKEKVERELGKNIEIDYLREKEPAPSYNVDFSKIEKRVSIDKRFDLELGIDNLLNHYEKGKEEVGERWNP